MLVSTSILDICHLPLCLRTSNVLSTMQQSCRWHRDQRCNSIYGTKGQRSLGVCLVRSLLPTSICCHARCLGHDNQPDLTNRTRYLKPEDEDLKKLMNLPDWPSFLPTRNEKIGVPALDYNTTIVPAYSSIFRSIRRVSRQKLEASTEEAMDQRSIGSPATMITYIPINSLRGLVADMHSAHGISSS